VPSLDDWEKEWGKIHNAACNPNCCRWISGRHWQPSGNRINNPTHRALHVLKLLGNPNKNPLRLDNAVHYPSNAIRVWDDHAVITRLRVG
jgi:hypothetical protein